MPLDPRRIRVLCLLILGVSLSLAALSVATARDGRTFGGKGPPLGGDFAGYYTAARLLDAGGRLYDPSAHDKAYHQLLPGVPEWEKLPYVYPPLVALAFRPLAALPYAWSFACWLTICGALYVAGFLAAWSAAGLPSGVPRTTALLAALAFEPFIMECWLGGQMAAFGFLCLALAWRLDRRGRSFAAGLMFALGLYKPPLLVLLVPMALLARRWRVLAGMATGAAALFAVAILSTGWQNTADYAQTLLSFARTAAGNGQGLQLRLWKYVDANSFARLLVPGQPQTRWLIVGLLGIGPVILLVRLWWRLPQIPPAGSDLAWAATLTWTLVLNVYVGVYDSLLAVLSSVITAGVFWRESRRMPAALAGLLLAVCAAAWVTQPLARPSGLQVYTLLLMGLGAYQIAQALASHRQRGGGEPSGRPALGSPEHPERPLPQRSSSTSAACS